jgi:hypothetical protein
MVIEVADVTADIGSVNVVDPVMTLDPVEMGLVAIATPLPLDGQSDLPPDAQTFGGPAESSSDPVAATDVTATPDDTNTVSINQWSGDAPKDGGSAGASTDGGDNQPVTVFEGYPVFVAGGWDTLQMPDKGTTDSGTVADAPGTVVETLNPTDPLIYMTALADSPGRPADPLPFERTNSVSIAAPEPEVDRAAVHYAAADMFHAWLHLL